MGDLRNIEKILASARAKAFLNAPKIRKQSLKHAVMMESLAALLWHERDLMPQRLELAELPFDRLRLTYCPHYRHSREVAAELGIAFSAQYLGKDRVYEDWDPAATCVRYTPNASELAWLASNAQSVFNVKKAFEQFRACSRDIHHDLSHIVFFSLVRPTSGSVLHYYVMAESFARLRDLLHTEEAGPLREPLAYAGSMNYFFKNPKTVLRQELTFELFAQLFTYVYLQRDGLTDAAIVRLCKKHKQPLLDEKTRKGCFKVGEDENWNWFAWHVRKFGKTLRLPPESSDKRKISIPIPSPREAAAKPQTLKPLYEWYCSLYLTKP